MAGGQVWGWGSNERGQLGDGTRVNRRTPIWMPLFTTATQVAAGSTTSVMLVAGQPLQWGEPIACDFGGEILLPCPIPEDSPHFAAIQLFGVRQISAGSDHGVAIRFDGTVWQWWVQSGDEPAPPASPVPSVGGAVQVDDGDAHTAALVDRPPVVQP